MIQAPEFPIPPIGSWDSAAGVQVVWDSTSIKTAETCLRKYYYQSILGLSLREGKSVHLWFGGIYASALESFYKHRFGGADHETALRNTVREALVESWNHDLDDAGFRIPGTGAPPDYTDPNKTRENLIRSIVWYIEEFRDDPYEVIALDNGQPAVELTFKLPLETGPILSGHIDRMVRDPHGHAYVMDQKTTKATITPRFFDNFSPDTQMSCYTLAGTIAYQTPVKGVIIDAAQIAVGFTRFERGFTHRTDDMIEEWLESALWHIDTAQRATRERRFPMNTESCDKYGGCPFRPICRKPVNLRAATIQGDYTPGQWWDAAKPR